MTSETTNAKLHAQASNASETRRSCGAGERIFVEGEAGDHAYIIERGRVEITFQRQGRSVRIAILGPGEIFGEMALIDQNARSATATALIPTEVVVVGREQIERAMHGADPTMRLLLDVLLGRFRAMQGRMDWVAGEEPPADAHTVDATAALADASGDDPRAAAIERLKFQQELKQAVSDEAFSLQFQPIVSLSDGAVHGFEALIRWNDARRGAVPPGEFIKIAEATDLIQDIDIWMCRHVIGTIEKMCRTAPQGARIPYVAVNLSGISLGDDRVIGQIVADLKASGVDPSLLRVEITEGVLIDKPNKVAAVLDSLQSIGVRVAVDDFGTGYSSLGYLVGFPINTLKIDRVFVNNMLSNENSLEIVRAIIGMAHALGMNVVAEGVEESSELQTLWRMNCEYIQGFLISRPVSPDDAIAFAMRGPALSTGPVLLDY